MASLIEQAQIEKEVKAAGAKLAKTPRGRKTTNEPKSRRKFDPERKFGKVYGDYTEKGKYSQDGRVYDIDGKFVRNLPAISPKENPPEGYNKAKAKASKEELMRKVARTIKDPGNVPAKVARARKENAAVEAAESRA